MEKTDYCTMKIELEDLDASGITEKTRPLCNYAEKNGRFGRHLSFTLKQKPSVEVNSFIYRDQLYIVDQRAGLSFTCIAIKFVEV